jgi:stringent starvation protein B
MSPTARLPPKKDVALALLEQASMYVHLDPRAEAVQVPAWFKKQPQLVLQVGLNMAVPIPDLHVDDQGLSCTLSFNRSPFFCMIPWPAIFALVGENGQAMVWAEDVPAEVAAQAQAQKAPEKPRPHLRSVGEGASAAQTGDDKPAEPKVLEKKSSSKGKPSAQPAKESAKRAVKVAAKSVPAHQATFKPSAQKPVVKLSTEQKPKSKKPVAAAEPTAKPEAARPRPSPAALPAKKTAQPKPEAQRAATDNGKTKRELPPYLRIVK